MQGFCLETGFWGAGNVRDAVKRLLSCLCSVYYNCVLMGSRGLMAVI
jgi:hypothetical protein